jgi:hypothetical protein
VLGAEYKPLAEMLPAGLADQVGVTPEGRLRTANCFVPEGATIAVAGVTLGVGDACRVKLAVPRMAIVEEFVAVIVRVCWVGTLLGAEYKPLDEMLPLFEGLTVQVTATLNGRLRTENCWVPEGATIAVAGVTLDGGEASRVKLAVPRVAIVEELVAVTVIVV